MTLTLDMTLNYDIVTIGHLKTAIKCLLNVLLLLMNFRNMLFMLLEINFPKIKIAFLRNIFNRKKYLFKRDFVSLEKIYFQNTFVFLMFSWE